MRWRLQQTLVLPSTMLNVDIWQQLAMQKSRGIDGLSRSSIILWPWVLSIESLERASKWASDGRWHKIAKRLPKLSVLQRRLAMRRRRLEVQFSRFQSAAQLACARARMQTLIKSANIKDEHIENLLCSVASFSCASPLSRSANCK